MKMAAAYFALLCAYAYMCTYVCIHTCIHTVGVCCVPLILLQLKYCIAGRFGREKVWQIYSFQAFDQKCLVNE